MNLTEELEKTFKISNELHLKQREHHRSAKVSKYLQKTVVRQFWSNVCMSVLDAMEKLAIIPHNKHLTERLGNAFDTCYLRYEESMIPYEGQLDVLFDLLKECENPLSINK